MFYDYVDTRYPESLIPEAKFDEYVRRGRFSKDAIELKMSLDPRTGKRIVVRYVLYSLKGEEWRFAAMKMVLRSRRRRRTADEGLDRMAGLLLGYTYREVDRYIGSRCTDGPGASAENKRRRSGNVSRKAEL
jgi:hypothetical protein